MPVLRIGHYPEPTQILPTEIDTHKCRYVALLLYLWVSFGPGVGVKRLVEANRGRALGVGVEAVKPKAIAGEQPELGVCRFD
jgi:hypothetical protein